MSLVLSPAETDHQTRSQTDHVDVIISHDMALVEDKWRRLEAYKTGCIYQHFDAFQML